MDQPDGALQGRTVIGGRHGSPSLTIALPFARISSNDDGLRDAVADLANLVARLAGTASSDQSERALVREAAEELANRVSSRD
jgi:hypothetical protein